MKRYLFYITFLPLCVPMIALNCCSSILLALHEVCEGAMDLLSKWEGWCLDYKKEWKYIGGGAWKGKDEQ